MAGRTAVVAALLSSLVLATVAAAQSVPLPIPAPFPKTTATPPPPASAQLRPPGGVPQGGANQPARQVENAPAASGFPNIFKPPNIFGKPGETTAFDERQRALIVRVSNYLASVRVLSGDFVQIGPDGGKTEGEFYLQKPGRVRFDYNPPSPIELIADGSSVVVRDRKLVTQDLYPLSQTPLRFLLADNLDLLRDTNLIAVYADDVFITMVIEERQVLAGTYRLMLMFSAQDTQLKQWTITDPQGMDTTVAVYNLNYLKRPDPNLFRIDYTRDVK